MPELVGFQTMMILDPNGITFDAVGVFGLVFYLNLAHHTVDGVRSVNLLTQMGLFLFGS